MYCPINNSNDKRDIIQYILQRIYFKGEITLKQYLQLRICNAMQ